MRAGATAGCEAEHHLLTRQKPARAGSDGFDDSGSLVAEHDRELMRPLPVCLAHVAVTDAAGDHPNPDLAEGGVADLDGFNRLRRAEGAQNRCGRLYGHRAAADRTSIVDDCAASTG